MSEGKRTVGDQLIRDAMGGVTPAPAPDIVSIRKHKLLRWRCKSKQEMFALLAQTREDLDALSDWAKCLKNPAKTPDGSQPTIGGYLQRTD